MVGPSGAGKTTVLNILGEWIRQQVERSDRWKEYCKVSAEAAYFYRRDDIGFVFQFYNLIPNLTALENVELAPQICKDPLDAEMVLRGSGTGRSYEEFPGTAFRWGAAEGIDCACTGKRTRKLLLCDEPTGALDYNTGKAILKLLQDMCRERGMTVILITHQFSDHADGRSCN